MSERARHWDTVYRTRRADEVSWFQPQTTLSRELIEQAAADRGAAIIDVGGGASRLVDELLAAGYAHLTVLDVSATALTLARERLGPAAESVTWLAADVLDYPLPPRAFDVWHDRAVFHFLTDDPDRQRYVEQLRSALKVGGHAVIETFAEDGPTRCSGLPVARYTFEALARALGPAFTLETGVRQTHVTPAGAPQHFIACVFALREHDEAGRPPDR